MEDDEVVEVGEIKEVMEVVEVAGVVGVVGVAGVAGVVGVVEVAGVVGVGGVGVGVGVIKGGEVEEIGGTQDTPGSTDSIHTYWRLALLHLSSFFYTLAFRCSSLCH